MNKAQFKEAIARLGLTQGQAAKALGVSIRSVNGYANGKPIPFLVAEVIRLWVLRPGDRPR